MRHYTWPTYPVISTIGQLESPVDWISGVTGMASTAWPAVSLALYVPFYLHSPFTYDRFFTMGTTASGNVDIGIYTASGIRLVSTGLTAVAFTSNVQTLDVTNGTLDAGAYFLAMCCDNTTVTIDRSAPNAQNLRGCGMFQEDLSGVSGVLPATATFAAVANAYYPLFGVSSRSFI